MQLNVNRNMAKSNVTNVFLVFRTFRYVATYFWDGAKWNTTTFVPDFLEYGFRNIHT
jgi:hypothetical protein